MITNERQYRITRSQAEKFRQALRDFSEIDMVRQGIDPAIARAHRSSLEQQLKELDEEIARYETLRSGSVDELSASSIIDTGEKLIEARIVRGMSQRELADRLGMKEQQIQRYEQERYRTASLTRVAEVAGALGLQLEALFRVRMDESAGRTARETRAGFDFKKLPAKDIKKPG